MKYARISVHENEYGKLFPEDICQALIGKKTYIYGAMRETDDELCGAAAVSVTGDSPPAALLHYVTVNEKSRRRGIGAQLLL